MPAPTTSPASVANSAHPPSPSVRCWSTAPPGRFPVSGTRDTSASCVHMVRSPPVSSPAARAGPGRYGSRHHLSIGFMIFRSRRARHEPSRTAGVPAVTLEVVSTVTQIPEHTVAVIVAIAAGAGLVGIVVAALLGRRTGRRALQQRLSALASRLGADAPEDDRTGVEPALHRLELVSDRAAEAVAEASADAIRLRRALDNLPQGVIVCDEDGKVVFRNTRAVGLMGGRHGD